MAHGPKKRLSWAGFFRSLVTSALTLFAVFFVVIGVIVGASAGYQLVFSDDPLTTEQLLSRLRATAGGAVGLALLWTVYAGIRLLFDPNESPWRTGQRGRTFGEPSMRTFFTTVLIAGLPFGALLGLLGADSVTELVGTVIIAGVLFGVLLAAVLSLVQWWTTRRARTGGAPKRRARAECTVVVELPLSAAYRKCFDAAMALSGPGAVRQDRDSSRITVQTDTSWKSWGEHVTLQLSADDTTATTVSVSSRSAMRTTVFDYGKNRQNVDRVVDWLTEAEDERYRDWRQSLGAQFDR